MLGPAGFHAAEDILAITVNRWPLGYAYTYDTIADPDLPPEQRPHIVGRQRFGQVTIANADAGAARIHQSGNRRSPPCRPGTSGARRANVIKMRIATKKCLARLRYLSCCAHGKKQATRRVRLASATATVFLWRSGVPDGTSSAQERPSTGRSSVNSKTARRTADPFQPQTAFDVRHEMPGVSSESGARRPHALPTATDAWNATGRSPRKSQQFKSSLNSCGPSRPFRGFASTLFPGGSFGIIARIWNQA